MAGSRRAAGGARASSRADARRRTPASGARGPACAALLSGLLALVACGGEPVPPPAPQPAAPPPEAAAAPPPAPVRRGALRPGAGPVTGELAAGGVDVYDLDLDAGRFVRLVVDQQGIGLVPELRGPDGGTLVAADRPTGAWGPELILAVSGRPGGYALWISAPGDGARGRYQVRFEESRPAAPADRALAEAYRRFTEARALDAEQRPGRWSETVEMARRLGAAELEGEALNRLGTHAFQRGANEEAAELYRAAAAAFARAGAPWGEAIARVSRGACLVNLRALDEAAAELAAGLDVARAAGDRQSQARALHALGDLAVNWGELQRALDFYQPALELWPDDDPFFPAATLHGLGVVLARYLGDREKGRERLREAAATWPDDSPPAYPARTLNQLGQLAYEDGAPAEARRLFEESLALIGDGTACTAAVIQARLGLVEQAGGAGEASDRRLGEALAAVAGGACPVSEPTVLLLGAELAERRDDRPAALERYRRALELYTARRDAWGRVECLDGIARIERDRGASAAALDAADRALALIEGVRPTILREDLRTSYFARAQGLFELRIDLLAAAGRFEEAWVTAERARAQALRDLLIEAGAGLREEVGPALAARERELRRRLNALESRRVRAESNPERLRAIERAIDAVVADLESVRGESRRGLGGGAGADPATLTASTLRRRLDPGTLLLEVRLGAGRSHLWAVTRDAVEWFELPPRAEIERLARRAAAWFGSAQWPRGRNPGPACALSRAVLGPAAELLDGRRLLLVADGALETIAFAALPDPGAADCATAPPLVAGREIAYLPSAAVLGTLQRRLAGRRPAPGWLAVVADPVYGTADERLDGRRGGAAARAGLGAPARGAAEEAVARTFSRLPHAGAEAAAIRALLPADRTFAATGFDAGRETVLGGALSRYRILHFATHGVLDADRPLLSFLALAQLDPAGRRVPGPLYAHEIYGLDLPAELVVLSACDTARGREVRGEGLVSGLPRAFLYAGAARVLVSLWEVGDESTRELMTAFYRGLIEQRLSPPAALREAQLAMWRDRRPPYRWAGFVLQGDPRPLPAFSP